MYQPRYQKFEQSIHDLMAARFTGYDFVDHNKWRLIYTTNNRSKCVQRYKLVINNQPLINYSIDEYLDVFGRYHEEQIVYRQSQIGDDFIDILTNAFKDCYFDSYLYEDGKLLSYTKMLNAQKVNDEDDDRIIKITATIEIVYHKKHLPFPVRETLVERLEREKREMTETIEKQNERLQYQNFQNRRLKDTIDKYRESQKTHRQSYITFQERYIKQDQLYANQQQKFIKQIRKLYAMSSENEDCPVCYEPLCVDTFAVPTCSHYICHDCYTKCVFCPICRDNYKISDEIQGQSQISVRPNENIIVHNQSEHEAAMVILSLSQIA